MWAIGCLGAYLRGRRALSAKHKAKLLRFVAQKVWVAEHRIFARAIFVEPVLIELSHEACIVTVAETRQEHVSLELPHRLYQEPISPIAPAASRTAFLGHFEELLHEMGNPVETNRFVRMRDKL